MPAQNLSALEKQLNGEIMRRRPLEAGDLLDDIDPIHVAAIINEHDPQVIAPVLESMSPASWLALTGHLDPDLMVQILNRISAPRAAGHLRVLKPEMQERLLKGLGAEQRADVELILGCAPDTAGSVMDPKVIYLRPDLTVQEALGRLRTQKYGQKSARARRVMFVVNNERRIQGIVAIQDLALAEPTHLISEYVQTVPAVVSMTSPKEDIVNALEEHRLSSLPVVDDEGHLVGVVRYEELVAAAKEDASADLQTMFGVSRDEKALSAPWFAVRKRLPWLQINLLTAFLAAGVVGLFESTIAKYTALAVLLPVVAGQSGNTGAQALAVVIRGLALREISIAHWRKAVFKESIVGLTNGIAVALTTAAGVYIWSRSLGLTAVIGISMVISMVLAGIAGAAIPLVLTRLGQDPAQSSSIVLTTVTDVAGFFSFLGIATIFLAYL